jgi:hypothetical protein
MSLRSEVPVRATSSAVIPAFGAWLALVACSSESTLIDGGGGGPAKLAPDQRPASTRGAIGPSWAIRASRRRSR